MHHDLFPRKSPGLAKHQLCLDSLGFRQPQQCTTQAASLGCPKAASYLPACGQQIGVAWERA